MTTTATEVTWEYVRESGAQPYRNRGFYTGTYLLHGPKTREEALAAVAERRKTAWPVESFTLGSEREPGVWAVAYSMDSTD